MNVSRHHYLTIAELAQRWKCTESDIVHLFMTHKLPAFAFVTCECDEWRMPRIKLRGIAGKLVSDDPDRGPVLDPEGNLNRYFALGQPYSIPVTNGRDGPNEPIRPRRGVDHFSAKLEDVRIIMSDVEEFERKTGILDENRDAEEKPLATKNEGPSEREEITLLELLAQCWRLKYGPDIIEKLKRERSDMTQKIANDMGCDRKTIKKYVAMM